ncbi:hypothetical protein [Orgyia pseudotsugata single capsid nuclopolyhedrovirus]|nr:hypothetical protein [Orgyia pseudotsugata single capsid nuclopolyhedrovirus]
MMRPGFVLEFIFFFVKILFKIALAHDIVSGDTSYFVAILFVFDVKRSQIIFVHRFRQLGIYRTVNHLAQLKVYFLFIHCNGAADDAATANGLYLPTIDSHQILLPAARLYA